MESGAQGEIIYSALSRKNQLPSSGLKGLPVTVEKLDIIALVVPLPESNTRLGLDLVHGILDESSVRCCHR